MYHTKVSEHENLLERFMKVCWGGFIPLNFLSPHRTIQSNPSVIIIFRIKYFVQFYDQIYCQKVSIRFNLVPTSSLYKCSYALLFCIQVLYSPSIFVTFILYVLYTSAFSVGHVVVGWIIRYSLHFLISITFLSVQSLFIIDLSSWFCEV